LGTRGEQPSDMARSKALRKVLIAVVVIAGFGVLFVRSIRDTQSAPYAADLARLRNWTVAIAPATMPTDPMLVLRPPPELVGALFRQIFSRTMESLNVPGVPGMPLVLRGEFDRALAAHMTPESVADAARQAGLEQMTLQPRCVGLRRVSAPGVTRQLYFILFDAPAFERFRQQIAASQAPGQAAGAGFDPAALSPVLLIAEAAPAPGGWLPLRSDPDADCLAPLTVG